MNILLVEDDLVLAKSTAKLIDRSTTDRVTITIDPQEIIDLAQAGDVDLILMDMNLPQVRWQEQLIDGLGIVYLLKNQANTQKIPIILLSAYVMTSEADSLLSASGADDFLPKPIIDYSVLVNKIESFNLSEKCHEL